MKYLLIGLIGIAVIAAIAGFVYVVVMLKELSR